MNNHKTPLIPCCERSFCIGGENVEYEVRHEGAAVGTLEVSTEGLMTVFEARTRRLEGLQRLWVCGAEKSGYLGVLMPAGNELCLRKKLSRRDRMEFPEVILYASTAGKPEEPAEVSSDDHVDAAPEERAAEPSLPSENDPEENEPVWHSASMGTLTAVRDGVIYTAIPAMLRRTVRGVHIETIHGEKYIIFRRSY